MSPPASLTAAPAWWAAALTAALAAAPAGCLRNPAFACEIDAQCTGKTAGVCVTAVGYCAFNDGTCSSGTRFGEHAGPYSGQCVGATGDDAGIDGALPEGCIGAYAALPGIATHKYRLITTLTSWSAQATTCASERAYLVEPDDAAELAALNMLAGAVELWVGVSDQATEGTFVYGRGGAVTFLPWENNQPDDAPQPGADCVRSSATGTYADDKCVTARRTVCECEL